MSNRPSQSELIAYIDGALAPEKRAAVEKEIAANRQLRHQLRQLIKLRSTARKAVRDSTDPVPDALRARIEAMLQVEVQKPVAKPRTQVVSKPVKRNSPWIYPIWRPALVAGLAACIAIGVWVGLPSLNDPLNPSAVTLPRTIARTIVQDASRAGLPAELVSVVQARHLKCVMMGNNFEDPKFSHILADVGPAVRQYLGDSVAIPDLSSINLDFAGVGPCQVDGGKTLHWLFRNPSDPKIHVSVFVQPFSGQVAFDQNSAFVIAGPNAQFPMLVWRDDKFVYYLIGDDFGATSQTATKLGVGFGI